MASSGEDQPDQQFQHSFWRSAPLVPDRLPELSADGIGDEQFRLLADNIPTLCWIANGDGYIVWYNRRWHDYCGTSPEQMEGWGWQSVHDADLLPEVMERWTKAVATGDPFEMTFPLRGADGIFRPFLTRIQPVRDASGKVVRWFGVNTEISEQHRAEAALRELNETLEQRVAERTAERNRVWEMSRDLLAIMGFDGKLKAINPAWETTFGTDTETLLSLSFREQVHPDDHPAVVELMARLMSGESVAGFEDRIRHADGSWRWISWNLVPEGEVFYAVGRDVTAEKAAAAELEQAQEALRQSQKMDAIGQLTGGVAHDFNNLLTPIIGSLDMLIRRGLGSARERRLIDGALQSAEKAQTLVQRLLAFARRQPLQPQPVDVDRLIADMAELVASTSGPHVKVVVDTAPDLQAAQADPNQLEMAVLNLAVNARDAMPEGGTLTISARCEDLADGHTAKLPPGRYMRLSVADTGVGMDETTLARSIEPFFSTKGLGKGTGLGLSMVHGLAAQLNGALVIDSKLGLGTCVELWLPLSQEAAPQPEPTEKVDAAAAAGIALLVDDEDLVRATTAEMLSSLGYGVVEADSGEQALRLVDGGLKFDLLVTDHLMPGMKGAELARALLARFPDRAALVVSGYAEVDGIAADLPRLNKPFRLSDLAAALAEAVARAE